jgi:5-dehydro-2-deoxygluconokinase
VRWLGFHPSLRTPLAFCELFPPDNFPLLFYRSPLAPDATISSSDFDIDIAASAAIVWTTGTGLATDAGRNAAMALLADRRAEAVHDLDYREVAWASPAAAAAANRNAIRFASVVVGNLEEAAMVTGSWDPSEASANLLAFGPRLAVVKCGPAGVFFRSEEGAHLEAGVPVSVVNGLGAGDAFGGALCFALRRGWPIDTTARFCNVAGALVATRLACADAMPTVEEINQFMAGHSA